MPISIPYKSFCWSLGTTSFRTKNFNKKIEEQLSLLHEFWSIPENNSENWKGNNTLQEKYYNFMKHKGFVVGKSNNKSKDAREKTSGLVDIGLIDNERKLTNAGLALLHISETNDFSDNNPFHIPKDSFIYLKQLLKTSNDVDGNCVRPFIVLLYVLSKVEYLTLEEFTYLLPLCIDETNTDFIIEKIEELHKSNTSIDSVIIDRLMAMENYKAGMKVFLNNVVNEDVICTVGINRKSRKYDRPYFRLYNELYNVFIRNDKSAIIEVFKATKPVNIGKFWRRYLFDTIHERTIEQDPEQHLNVTEFDNAQTEDKFKKIFFKIMHLFKAKAILHDYLDLNRRYIKTTDIVLFEDNTVKIDIVPKHFFNSVINELYRSAFVPSDKLFEECTLEEIDDSLVINEAVIVSGINTELGAQITNMTQAHTILEENRYRRLQHLIDNKFTDDKILTLLNLFETRGERGERGDTEIRNMVTDNADIPTIFEYVLGILWYKTSGRQGKILDYMKLSLDADLLPKTHAAGGEADIVYEYEETEDYPQHTLLLEATLTDGTNQRRTEMEPVTRHLGQHLIRTGNLNSYCVFATNFLNINVISDFKNRKTTPYYDTNDYEKFVDGMKIIPLRINELKTIISENKKYAELYHIFENAYISDLRPHEWYGECIEKKI